MYFLDTTAVIELFKGNEKLKTHLRKDGAATTTISYFEIFSKILHKNLKQEKTYFTRFFASIPVYPFGTKAAAESSRLMVRLYKRGTPINSADVVIAGITQSQGGEGIVTKDRDFVRIQEVSDLDVVFI